MFSIHGEITWNCPKWVANYFSYYSNPDLAVIFGRTDFGFEICLEDLFWYKLEYGMPYCPLKKDESKGCLAKLSKLCISPQRNHVRLQGISCIRKNPNEAETNDAFLFEQTTLKILGYDKKSNLTPFQSNSRVKPCCDDSMADTYEMAYPNKLSMEPQTDRLSLV